MVVTRISSIASVAGAILVVLDCAVGGGGAHRPTAPGGLRHHGRHGPLGHHSAYPQPAAVAPRRGRARSPRAVRRSRAASNPARAECGGRLANRLSHSIRGGSVDGRGRADTSSTSGLLPVDRDRQPGAGNPGEQADVLTRLDAEIGDGDHGINMSRGTRSAVAALVETPQLTSGSLLELVGRQLVLTVGRSGRPALRNCSSRQARPWAGGLRRRRPGRGSRRRTGRGAAARSRRDRRQDDGGRLLPAVVELQNSVYEGTSVPEALDRAASAAEMGMVATIPVARLKGEGVHLGPRSESHQDSGAQRRPPCSSAAYPTPPADSLSRYPGATHVLNSGTTLSNTVQTWGSAVIQSVDRKDQRCSPCRALAGSGHRLGGRLGLAKGRSTAVRTQGAIRREQGP